MCHHGTFYKRATCVIVGTFHQNGESWAATVRRLRAILWLDEAPNESTVRKLMKKFNETDSTVNIKNSGPPCSGQSVESITLVHDSINVVLMKLVRRRSQELGMGYSLLRRILVHDLHYHPIKFNYPKN